jgi:ZIP family zinc transporter
MPYFAGKSRLIDYSQLILLGGIAGFTIFLGLPLAAVRSVGSRKKGFLNAVAIGILIFLTADVFGHGWEAVGVYAGHAFAGTAPVSDALLAIVAMFGGLGAGLLGLAWFGTRFTNDTSLGSPARLTTATRGGYGLQKQELQVVQRVDAYRLSMMIAIGIGAHNFSEGLAIGQSYASGAIGLALMLIIGFAAHNATEGFGIAGPLTNLPEMPRVNFLILSGMIGGGPTFIGTILGSLWTSGYAYILFLALAGGALIYVSLLMYNVGRGQVTNNILMVGIFLGLLAGFATDLMVTLGGA